MSETEDLRRAEDRMTTEIKGLESRFDKHLLIYANNGLALKELTVVINTMQASVYDLSEQHNSQSIKVNDMYAQYQDDKAVEVASTKWKESIVLWGRVLTAMAVIGAALTFVLSILPK